MKTIRKVAHGFTLVEMLITVSIASLTVVFFAQLWMKDFERTQWDLKAQDLMTLNRVVSLAYIDSSGLWPGEVDSADGGCENAALVEASLRNYLPVFDFEYTFINAAGDEETADRYTFGCTSNSFSIATRFLDNNDGDSDDDEAAQYIAAALPVAGANGEELTLHVIKPRMQYATQVTHVSATLDSGTVQIQKDQISCSNARISVQPMSVCVEESEAMGGYRIDISGENDDSVDHWTVTVTARTDSSSAYSPVSDCDGEVIDVRAMLFCQD